MKSKLRSQAARHAASRRLQAPVQTDLAWKQWGQALVEQYPHHEWPARLKQIPEIYRDFIRSRLIRDYGYKVE